MLSEMVEAERDRKKVTNREFMEHHGEDSDDYDHEFDNDTDHY